MLPKVAIIYTEGLNRDQESGYAFQLAGAMPEIVHLNELQEKEKKISDYEILFFPGGFSFGDDLFSAKIWASKMLAYLQKDLENFIKNDKLIIGVCNGFQCLVRLGLLPFNNLGSIEASLTHNKSGHFECRWINVKVEKSNCVFTQGMEGQILRMPTAHGEGRFLASESIIQKIENNNQVVFRYVNNDGTTATSYPESPSGSTNAISGLCSPNGKILGLMPHPECNTKWNQHPNWNQNEAGGETLQIFKNAVNYFK